MKMLKVWVIALLLAACNEAVEELPSAASVPQGLVPTHQPTATPTRQQTPAPAYTSFFETADCQFEHNIEAEVQCGYLVVPEQRSRPERTIRLHTAIIPSRSSTPLPDPLVFLNGGPGAHTLVWADFYAARFDDILEQRDLILLDQRGVGFSEPALDCPEIIDDKLVHIEEDLDPAVEKENYLAAMELCYERLTAAGIDFSAYNSAASAADLDDLRRELGYESWNMLGISYGTRLALTAVRDFGHTGTIRSVVLDSTYPPQIDAYLASGANLNNAFDLLFARCANNESCNRAFPDLRFRFYALVEKLNAEPTTVFVTDQQTRKTYQVPFNGYDLIDTLFEMMYNPDQIIKLPRLLTRLEQDRTFDLSEWLTNALRQSEYFSQGMTVSVQCTEEMPFNNLAGLQGSLAGLPPQLADFIEINAHSFSSSCDLWQVEPAAANETQPVSSDIPTLILAGDYDPITPPSFGHETAAHLDQAYTFELLGQSHGVVTTNDCAVELLVGFLNEPHRPPDDSCLDGLYVGFAN